MVDAAKYADLVLLLIDAAFGFEMETFEFLNMLQVIPCLAAKILLFWKTERETKKAKKGRKGKKGWGSMGFRTAWRIELKSNRSWNFGRPMREALSH